MPKVISLDDARAARDADARLHAELAAAELECRYDQWDEPSGLVLTIARTSKAQARVLLLVADAFPETKRS